MTDQLPGRTPPWGPGSRTSPAGRPAHPIRIGDAERDEALDTLGDHFAAGRLTREEFDERSERALGARFDSELEPLFGDLPDRSRAGAVRRARPQGNARLSAVVAVLMPLLVLAVVASIVLHGPVFIGPLLWLLVLSGLGRRHRCR